MQISQPTHWTPLILALQKLIFQSLLPLLSLKSAMSSSKWPLYQLKSWELIDQTLSTAQSSWNNPTWLLPHLPSFQLPRLRDVFLREEPQLPPPLLLPQQLNLHALDWGTSQDSMLLAVINSTVWLKSLLLPKLRFVVQSRRIFCGTSFLCLY